MSLLGTWCQCILEVIQAAGTLTGRGFRQGLDKLDHQLNRQASGLSGRRYGKTSWEVNPLRSLRHVQGKSTPTFCKEAVWQSVPPSTPDS